MKKDKESDKDADRKTFYVQTTVLALVVAAMLFVADGMVQSGQVPAAAIPGVIVMMIAVIMLRFRRTIDPEERNRIKLICMAAVLTAVVGTFLGWAAFAAKGGGLGRAVLPGIVAATLVVLGARFVKGQWEAVSSGLPLEDERSQRVKDKAGAWTFYAGLYWLLALSFYDDHVVATTGASAFRDAQQALGIGVLGLVLLFGFWYWYHNRTGEVE